MSNFNWSLFMNELPITMVGVFIECVALLVCYVIRDRTAFTATIMVNVFVTTIYATKQIDWAGMPSLPGQMAMVSAMLGLGLCYGIMGKECTYKVWRSVVFGLLLLFFWTHRFDLQDDIPGYDVAEHYRNSLPTTVRPALAVLGSFIYIGAFLQIGWNWLSHQPPWLAYTLTMVSASLVGAVEFVLVGFYGSNEITAPVQDLIISVFTFRLWCLVMFMPFVIGLIHLNHHRSLSDVKREASTDYG